MIRSTLAGTTPTWPPAYVIGTQRIHHPLVTPEHVKGHICLLRAFYNLRITVEDCKDHRIPGYAINMTSDARWRWFVHLAVERFERWVTSLEFGTVEEFARGHIPPVDVWMVWHAYLLSPCWYAEDCERLAVLHQLRLLNVFVVGSVNIGKIIKQNPSNTRVEAWVKRTGMPFDPFEAMTVTKGKFKELECPRCRTMAYVPFVTTNGTGFAEGDFSVICPLPGCKLKITRDNLAVAKFVRDLSEGDEKKEHFIAGTLFSPLGNWDPRHAKVVRNQLMRSAYFAGLCSLTANERLVKLDKVKEVKESIGYSLERLKEAITISLRNCPAGSVTRVLSAYTDGSPFSVNLVDAVLRQCHFTAQMYELGWLKSGVFSEVDKHEILEHSVMRYHAFLDLMTAHPKTMLVPTLDIDLVWHTHQLMASRYIVDCEMYVGHHVDHEMCVTESCLSSAFNDTRRAWQTRFQASYTQCGCSIPHECYMLKLIRFVRFSFRGRSQLRMHLHPEHIPATHLSAHNALLSQTVCTGTLGRVYHNGKRKEKRRQTVNFEILRSGDNSGPAAELGPDWMFSMHSPSMPVHFQRESFGLTKSSTLL